MARSLHYAHLALRIGLALTFLWFGLDKFFRPEHWISAWVPVDIVEALARLGIGALEFVYFLGIVEVLISTSLISTLFLRSFAIVGIVYLALGLALHGFNEVMARDLTLIGGFIALINWPERRF